MDFPVPYPKETLNSSVKSIASDIQKSIASLPNAAYVWKLAQQKTHESLLALSATNRSDKLNFVKRTAFPSADKEKAALELLYKSDLWGALLESSRPTKGILAINEAQEKTLKPVLEIPLLSKTLCDLVYQEDLLTVFNDLVLNTKVPYSMLAKLTQIFIKDKHTTPNNFTLHYPKVFSLVPTQTIYDTAAGTITTNDLKFFKDSPAALLFERLTEHRKRHTILTLSEVVGRSKDGPGQSTDLQEKLFARLRKLAGFDPDKTQDYVIQGDVGDMMAPWYVYIYVLVEMLAEETDSKHPLVALWSNPDPCRPRTELTIEANGSNIAHLIMSIANTTDAPDWDWPSMYAYGDWIRKRIFRYCLERGISLKAPLGFVAPDGTYAMYLNGLVRVFTEYNEMTKTGASPEMQKMFDAYLKFFKETKDIKVKSPRTSKTEIYEYPNLYNTFKNVYLDANQTIPLPGASDKPEDMGKLATKRAKLSEELTQVLNVAAGDAFTSTREILDMLKKEWNTCGSLDASFSTSNNIMGWYKEIVQDDAEGKDEEAMATKIVDTLLTGWPNDLKSQVVKSIVSRTQSLHEVVPESPEDRIVALTGFNFMEYKTALNEIVPSEAISMTFQDYDEAVKDALLSQATTLEMRQTIEEFFSTPIDITQLSQRARAILNLKKNVDLASSERENTIKHNDLFNTTDKNPEQVQTTLAKYQKAMGIEVNPNASSQNVYDDWIAFLENHNAHFKTSDITPDDAKKELQSQNELIPLNEKTALTDDMDLPRMLAIITKNREDLKAGIIADAKAKAEKEAEDQRIADAKAKAEKEAEDQRIADAKAKAEKEAEDQRIADAKAKAEQEAEDQRIADAQARLRSLISNIAELNNVDDDIKSTIDISEQLPGSITDLEQLQSKLESEKTRLEYALNAKHQKNITRLNEIRDQLSLQPPVSQISPTDQVTHVAFNAIRDQLSQSEKELEEANKSLMKKIASLKPIAASHGIDTSALENIQGKNYKDLKATYEDVEQRVQDKTRKIVEDLTKEISDNIGVGSYNRSKDAEFNAKISGFENRINALNDTISDASIEELAWHLAKTAYNAYEQRDHENKIKNKRMQEQYGGIKALNILEKFGIVTRDNHTALEQFFIGTKSQPGTTTYTGNLNDILHQLDQMKNSTQNKITPELKEKLWNRIFNQKAQAQLPPMPRKAQKPQWLSLTEQQSVSQAKREQPSSEATAYPIIGLEKTLASSSDFTIVDAQDNTTAIARLNEAIQNETKVLDLEVIDGPKIVERMLDATRAIKGVTGTPFSIQVHPNERYGDPNTLWVYTDPFVFARHYIKRYIQLPENIAKLNGIKTISKQYVQSIISNTAKKGFANVQDFRTSQQVLHYQDTYISHVLDLMLEFADLVNFNDVESRAALSEIILDGVNALNYWPVVYSLRGKTHPVIQGEQPSKLQQINTISNDVLSLFVEGVQVTVDEIKAFKAMMDEADQPELISSLPSIDTKTINIIATRVEEWNEFFDLLEGSGTDSNLKPPPLSEAKKQSIVSKAGSLSQKRAIAILQRSIDMLVAFSQNTRKLRGGAQRLPRSDKRNLRSKSPVKESKSPSKSKASKASKSPRS